MLCWQLVRKSFYKHPLNINQEYTSSHAPTNCHKHTSVIVPAIYHTTCTYLVEGLSWCIIPGAPKSNKLPHTTHHSQNTVSPGYQQDQVGERDVLQKPWSEGVGLHVVDGHQWFAGSRDT